jgi:hypothetical protein
VHTTTKTLTFDGHSKLLIVEGKDEEILFRELLKHLNINDVWVHPIDGKDKYSNFMKTLPLIPGFSGITHIGVVLDADDNAEGSFAKATSGIEKVGFARPKVPGVFRSKHGKSGAVYIIPENLSKTGMLENLFLDSSTHSDFIRFVEVFHQMISDAGIKVKNPAKSRSQTLLSSFEEYSSNLGVAAQKGYWDFNHAKIIPLKDFLLQFV